MAQKSGKQRVVCLVGPTASGKSGLAVLIAREFGGEVVSADSRQVYRALDIGSGKITKREMKGVPHHLLDVSSPKKIFTANDYVRLGRRSIDQISKAGKLPIVCGGTGFYIDALIGRLTLADVPPNTLLRTELSRLGADNLYEMLKAKDAGRAQTIDRNNKRRLIRALEIAEALGQNPSPAENLLYDVFWVGLKPSTQELKTRIDKRLSARLSRGMVAEAKRLHNGGLAWKRMKDLGLEYRFLARYLQKEISKQQFESELRIAIYHYSKRQMTYWRRNKDIRWYELADTKRIFEDIQAFLYS